MSLTIRIPREIDIALKLPEKEKKTTLLKELALSLYQRDLLSFGKARELARMSKWEFYDLLGARGIERHYSVDDFQEDLNYGQSDAKLSRIGPVKEWRST